MRINTTQQQALSVSNIAGTPPQASLDAQISAVGPATSNNGTINLLAPGATDTTSLIAGLSTAAAGAQSGMATVALQSNSTPNGCTSNCILDLTPQTINVSGNVYRLANPTLNTTSVSLAARVGDATPSANVSVTNASPDQFTENLKASFETAPTGFTNTGDLGANGLAAQGADSTSLKVGLASISASLPLKTPAVMVLRPTMSAFEDPPLPATPEPRSPLVVKGAAGAAPKPPVITSTSAPVAVLVTVTLWVATVSPT